MATFDLSTADGIRQAASAANPAARAQWLQELSETIVRVRDADLDTRSSRQFQDWLWEENNVAAPGQGNLAVDEALVDGGFRRWLAEASLRPLPADRPSQARFLSQLNAEILERLRPLLSRSSSPRLKVARVLCALFPAAMTTVASESSLNKLARAMGLSASDAATRHVEIRARLDEALGPAGDDPNSLAERISLPWMLYSQCVSAGDERGAEPLSPTTSSALPQPLDGVSAPLPAARRRRGLTATKGYFQGLLATLDFLGSKGATRQELLDYLHSEAPEAKASGRGTIINSYEAEFGAIRRDQNRYVLTDQGRQTLESGDPTPLSEWLLHRVLGADLTLFELRERGAMSSAELTALVRRANPGWTTDYAPRAIILWFRSMGAIAMQDGRLDLTERGVQWASRIVWTPELLAAEVIPPVVPTGLFELPPLLKVVELTRPGGHFDRELIAKLHAGLWSHERRHFAILTGLSGSGKTLLARAYATALASGQAERRLITIPVQPGWHDPSALLGYVNPIGEGGYVKTPFIDFVLAAREDPTRPYVVVLDEMNLSHPEQYMAPLLSAMETGDVVHLHSGSDELDGVPASVTYPSNLALIGTINMDETTHGLSDKVLDRAFVLEFWDVDLDAYPGWERRPALPAASKERAKRLLSGLLTALQPARLHFGWRVVDDVLDFLVRAAEGEVLSLDAALDAVVYAKVLPKLRGEDSPKFRMALAECLKVLETFGLVQSHRKVSELQADLSAIGSARFWR